MISFIIGFGIAALFFLRSQSQSPMPPSAVANGPEICLVGEASRLVKLLVNANTRLLHARTRSRISPPSCPSARGVLSWETRLLFIHFECLLSRSVIPHDSSLATQGNWQEL